MDIKEFARMGGKARAKKMTVTERRASSSKAGKARWDKWRADKRQNVTIAKDTHST